MSYKKITAIIDEMRLSDTINALSKLGIRGLSVTQMQGRGHYIDTYHPRQLIAASKLEIYSSCDTCKAIANCIIEIANVGCDHEGIVAISDIDELYWIHTKKEISLDELNIIENRNED